MKKKKPIKTSKQTHVSEETIELVDDVTGPIRTEEKRLSVDLVKPWAENPNEQDTESYSLLLEKLKNQYPRPDDMDQFPKVIPDEHDPGKYIVMSGNHRFKAAKELGAKTLRFTIWHCSHKRAILEAVSDNNVRGKLNHNKMAAALDSLKKRTDTPVQELAERMRFKPKEVEKIVKKQQDKALEAIEKRTKDKAKQETREVSKIDNLTQILNKLIREYGHTLEQEFMFFTYGNKLHLMLQMSDDLKEQMKVVTDRAAKHHINVNDVLLRCLNVEHIDQIIADLIA